MLKKILKKIFGSLIKIEKRQAQELVQIASSHELFEPTEEEKRELLLVKKLRRKCDMYYTSSFLSICYGSMIPDRYEVRHYFIKKEDHKKFFIEGV